MRYVVPFQALLLATLVSCHRQEPRCHEPTSAPVASPSAEAHHIDGLDLAMQGMAGPNATSCGAVGVNREDQRQVDARVVRAIFGKQAFTARYYFRGVDSVISGGIAGRPIRPIYVYSYDSDPSGGSRIGEQIKIVECVAPTISTTPTGQRLTCEGLKWP